MTRVQVARRRLGCLLLYGRTTPPESVVMRGGQVQVWNRGDRDEMFRIFDRCRDALGEDRASTLPCPLLAPLEAVAAAARAVVAELEACRDCCGDEHAEPLAEALAALDRARQETEQ